VSMVKAVETQLGMESIHGKHNLGISYEYACVTTVSVSPDMCVAHLSSFLQVALHGQDVVSLAFR